MKPTGKGTITGILPGRFMPFHHGHERLIRSAMNHCDRLIVLVCSSEHDPIPGWQRYHWVKNTFPELDVRHLTGAHPGSTERMKSILPENTTLCFEGSAKHVGVAQKIGLQHIELETEAGDHPVSSSLIRKNPVAYWDQLPEIVRPYYIRRVALLGPESCGKSYLAEKLAERFQTAFVEEYGRSYCEKFGMDLTELDFAHIAGGQLYREDEMARKANRVLFCDTDLIVTRVWSEIYFRGICQPWITWANHLRHYDLFLLLAPDIPWKNDGLREYEHQRDWMFERLRQELESRELPHVIIRGGFEDRTLRAVEAVQRLLQQNALQ